MSASSGDSGDGQDFDLNIAPIIDCFTVLIAYLLVSASFLSLTVFDVGIAVSGDGATPVEDDNKPKDPPMFLLIQMGANRKLEIRVNGGKEDVMVIYPIVPTSSGNPDLLLLRNKLKEYKERWPEIDDASVSAELSVRYKEIVNIVEAAKETFPLVYLSGERVSLSDDLLGTNEKQVQ